MRSSGELGVKTSKEIEVRSEVLGETLGGNEGGNEGGSEGSGEEGKSLGVKCEIPSGNRYEAVSECLSEGRKSLGEAGRKAWCKSVCGKSMIGGRNGVLGERGTFTERGTLAATPHAAGIEIEGVGVGFPSGGSGSLEQAAIASEAGAEVGSGALSLGIQCLGAGGKAVREALKEPINESLVDDRGLPLRWRCLLLRILGSEHLFHVRQSDHKTTSYDTADVEVIWAQVVRLLVKDIS